MKHYTVYDPRTGDIIRAGECQDHMLEHQARPGECVIGAQSNPATQRLDLGSLQPVDRPIVKIEPDYRERRLREYPPIGEQLDVIWKEMRNLPRTQETENMMQRILAVKEKHPKP